jgi:hypothetical protein
MTDKEDAPLPDNPEDVDDLFESLLMKKVLSGDDPHDLIITIRDVINKTLDIVPRMGGEGKKLWDFAEDKHTEHAIRELKYHASILVNDLGMDADYDLNNLLIEISQEHGSPNHDYYLSLEIK